eukprot:TRINITY_DN2261_c0_g1_i1.p1 TRINITY_DN2261_c0_g1~~TRINITY_DN2261_c0_g1_i1.p1  ORF type:complete len:525 (-),score=82.62 TRINITY_DN2261_c0_g1_i1:143-1717(-)
MEAQETVVFIKEVGQEEFDILYLSGCPDIEAFHAVIKESLGHNEEIIKLTMDGIAIRNANGIKFLLKKQEPKVEVTFSGTGARQQQASSSVVQQPIDPNDPRSHPGYKPPEPVPPEENQWITVLSQMPSSFAHSSVVVNDHLLCFGGFCDDLTQNHTLLLQTTANGVPKDAKMFQLRVRGDIPPARERHTASLIGKNMFVIGGYNRSSDLYFNSVYIFDTVSLTWSKVDTRGNIPERRCGHTASVIDGKIWIFGGRVKVKLGDSFLDDSVTQYRNDVYCYDPERSEWSRYEPIGHGPSGRALATATVVGRKIYIFGGANSVGNRHDTSGFCDLYALDIDTMTWSEVETKSTPPQPCYGHSATYIGNNQILMFGGKGFQVTANISVFDISTNEWKHMAFAGNTLVPRWGHSATLHRNRFVVIYGGRDNNGYWNTFDVIDVGEQLVEFKQDEQQLWEKGREEDMGSFIRESLKVLQVEVEELRSMVGQIGDELLQQQTENLEMISLFNSLKESQLELRKVSKELFK